MDIIIWTTLIGLVVALLLAIALSTGLLGLVVIGEQQVGIVVRKLGGRSLKPGQLIALNGEAGYQADTLAPGWHFWYWPVFFQVIKAPVIQVPQGEIALVVASDGYCYLVPYVEEDDHFFLKTVIPNRKATRGYRDYLKQGERDVED